MINPGISAALIAASRQEDVEQKIEGRLRKSKAVSQGSAIALELDGKQQQLLDQAVASGTVKRTDDGRLYLDEIAIANRTEGKGFMALLILLITGSLIASVAVLVARAGG